MASQKVAEAAWPTKIYVQGDKLPSMYLNPPRDWKEGRPTYRSSKPFAGTGMYFIIYFEHGEWRVSLSQFVGKRDKAYARVSDQAMDPSKITGTWLVFDKTHNRHMTDNDFKLSAKPEESAAEEAYWP